MSSVFFMLTMALYFGSTVCYLAYLLRRAETLSKVSLGITDHAYTQITGVLKGQLNEGDELIIRSTVPKNLQPGTLHR